MPSQRESAKSQFHQFPPASTTPSWRFRVCASGGGLRARVLCDSSCIVRSAPYRTSYFPLPGQEQQPRWLVGAHRCRRRGSLGPEKERRREGGSAGMGCRVAGGSATSAECARAKSGRSEAVFSSRRPIPPRGRVPPRRAPLLPMLAIGALLSCLAAWRQGRKKQCSEFCKRTAGRWS